MVVMLFRRGMLVAGLAVCACLGTGCESGSSATTKPLTFRERQDRAIKDPMNYKPDFSEDRISSGSIFDFDKKGFKKDLDSAFNP
jgi:hypothetical protein